MYRRLSGVATASPPEKKFIKGWPSFKGRKADRAIEQCNGNIQKVSYAFSLDGEDGISSGLPLDTGACGLRMKNIMFSTSACSLQNRSSFEPIDENNEDAIEENEDTIDPGECSITAS
ncbi:hypothetical protein NL676_012123 [Syzygium grande]|nr:hypothetical protein NL676_012123 [Syzygium grande]